MLETVEKMKKKGNFSKDDLAELGLGDNEGTEIPPVVEEDPEYEDVPQDGMDQENNPEESPEPESKAEEAFVTQVPESQPVEQQNAPAPKKP